MNDSYVISAKWWSSYLQKRFGKNDDGCHILSEEDILFLLIRYGRLHLEVIRNENYLFIDNTFETKITDV